MLESALIIILLGIAIQIVIPFLVFIMFLENIKIALIITILSELLLYLIYKVFFKKDTLFNNYLNSSTYKILSIFFDTTIMTLISYTFSQKLYESILASITSIIAVHLIGEMYDKKYLS